MLGLVAVNESLSDISLGHRSCCHSSHGFDLVVVVVIVVLIVVADNILFCCSQ